MNETTRSSLNDLHSADKELQNAAFRRVLEETARPVDWAYEVWDEMVESLSHKDNHRRAIAAQVLCNLAKSDPKKKMLKDFDALLAVTKDERFVPPGIAFSHCGKLVLRERTNRKNWSRVWQVDSKNASPKRTAL